VLIISPLYILTINTMKTSVSPRVCLVLVLFAITSNTARAGSATLGWQPSPSSGVVAYRIYYGTASTQYQWSVAVPNVSTAQVDGLAAGVTYYFAVKAVDATGAESAASNEVADTVSSSQTSSSSAATGLSNISTRSQVLTGDGATIGGFVIAGTDSSHTVLIRGLGPTLSSFGVAGALADPFLTLHQTDAQGNDQVIATNDNWKVSQQTSINATGLAPVNDAEAAILLSLPPGNYTAVLTGARRSTGIGLIEVYDLSTNTSSLLSNISTRGFVAVGDHALIGGFIANTDYTRVVVRVLGPTLQQFGVTGTLADPVLTLFDGNGNLIASNDNWADTQGADLQIAGYAPPDPSESAIIVTRPAGSTTAMVQGKNGGSGVALLEVYQLP
jgi:Fibronectin type III domain